MTSAKNNSPSVSMLPSQLAAVMILALPLLMAGCMGTPAIFDADMDDSIEWQPGEWWRYHVSGNLPAPWMDRNEGQFQLARDLGHEISIAVDREASFVAAPDPSNEDGDVVSGPHTTILSNDPTMEQLGTYGLPFATAWEIGIGTTLGPLAERYNKVGSMFYGTMFFGWPLFDGKTWKTNFMGRDLLITATLEDDMFQMVAKSGGQKLLRYTYDPEVRWFSFFEILDGSGNVQLRADLLDHGLDGFDGNLYGTSYGYSVWCAGGPGVLPASQGGCLTGTIAIRTYAGGQSLFFYYLAYRSEGPGFHSLIRHSSQPQGPELLNFEVCPCDTARDWVAPVDSPGVHVWDSPSVFSGDDRWFYLFIFYACQSIYRMDGTDLHVVDRCSR